MRTIAEKFKCLGSNEKAEEQRVIPLFLLLLYIYKYSYLQNYKKQEGEDVIIAAANQKDGVGKTKTFRREISLRLAEQKTIMSK